MHKTTSKILTICVIYTAIMMSIGISMGENGEEYLTMSLSNTEYPTTEDGGMVIYNGDGIPLSNHVIMSGSRIGGRYGYSQEFHADNGPNGEYFKIGKIGVYTQQYKNNPVAAFGMSRIQIRLGDRSDFITYSERITASDYSSDETGWHYIDIPDVEVWGDYKVELYTGSDRDAGISVYIDNTTTDKRTTQVDSNYHLCNWESYWDIDTEYQSEVNWMICVVESIDDEGNTDNYDNGYTDGYIDGNTTGYTDGHAAGIAEAILNEVIGDVTGDGKVNICDAVLLFNWVSFANERGTTYILR